VFVNPFARPRKISFNQLLSIDGMLLAKAKISGPSTFSLSDRWELLEGHYRRLNQSVPLVPLPIEVGLYYIFAALEVRINQPLFVG